MDLGGDAMDYDTSLLTRLKEEARLRHRHAADSRDPNGSARQNIKMIVSNWYTDELGNRGAHHQGARLKEKTAERFSIDDDGAEV